MMNDYLKTVENLKKELYGSEAISRGKKAFLEMAPIHRRVNANGFGFEPPKGARLGAVLILLIPKESRNNQRKVEWQTILMKRSSLQTVHKGEISFPGGEFDPDDPSLWHTALREYQEEIGPLTTDEEETISQVGELHPLYIPPGNFWIKAFVAALPALPKLAPNPKEVEKVILFDLDQCRKECRSEKEIFIPALNRFESVPSFLCGEEGEIIWGATAMLLANLREHLNFI